MTGCGRSYLMRPWGNTWPDSSFCESFPLQTPATLFRPSHRLLHHPPQQNTASFLAQPIDCPAAAFPPPLLRFRPIGVIPPHHLAPLPVPRVPFVSQVCQLAIMMAHAAATVCVRPETIQKVLSEMLRMFILTRATSTCECTLSFGACSFLIKSGHYQEGKYVN